MDFMDTIDKIGETLTSASKDIAKKAKDLMDVNTVRAAMNDQKRVICKAYERIGEQYYKEHAGAGTSDYEVEFEIIGEANAKLKELGEQLRILKKINVCPECGATVSIDARFCSKCGVKLQQPVPAESEEATVQETEEYNEVEEPADATKEPAAEEPDQREEVSSETASEETVSEKGSTQE